MAGKHRKSSRPRSSVADAAPARPCGSRSQRHQHDDRVSSPAPTPAVAPAVELMALVSAANSTSQIFAGSTYYGTDWDDVYGPQQVVPFLLGPQGIADAIKANDDTRERAT